MYCRSAASATSSSAPAEAAAGLDERDQAAAGDVEAFERALEVVRDLVGQPVLPAEDGLLVRDHLRRVALAPQDPGAGFDLVGAQLQDGVVQLARHGEEPAVRTLFVQVTGVVLGALDGDGGLVLFDFDVDVAVFERRQLDAALAGPAGLARDLPGPLQHGLAEPLTRHQLVDQPPVDGRLALDAVRARREDVGEVAPDAPLVDHARQPAGAGQHAQQRHLRQRDGRGVVVDQQDLFAGQRDLVPTASTHVPLTAAT